MDPISELQNELSLRKQSELQRVALELLRTLGTEACAFALPVPGTTPQLYVAFGQAPDIIQTLQAAADPLELQPSEYKH